MRKTEIVQVPADWTSPSGGSSRDAGKTFLLTEWPAEKGEKWAMRAILAYNRGGGQIDVAQALGKGMEAIFFLGIQTFLRGQIQAEEIIPILDQLLECVKIIRDPTARDAATGMPVATGLVSSDDIEEVQTRLWLRSEVLRLHTGFSPAAAVWSLISAIMTPSAPTEPPAPSPST